MAKPTHLCIVCDCFCATKNRIEWLCQRPLPSPQALITCSMGFSRNSLLIPAVSSEVRGKAEVLAVE